MWKVLLIFVLLLVGRGEAFAQFGYGGWWLPFGGNEVLRQTAGIQSLIWSLDSQWRQPVIYGPPQFVQPQVPPGYQVVCRGKDGRHIFRDMMFAGATGFGAALLPVGNRVMLNDWVRAAGGGAAGGGIGGLVAGHEEDCELTPIPGLQPQTQQTGQPVPSQPAPAIAPEVQGPPITVEQPMRLAGVEFRLKNETTSTITVEAGGRRAVLGAGATARVRTPDIRVFLVQRDGRGSFGEVELDLVGLEDETLPGWRITPTAKPKAP